MKILAMALALLLTGPVFAEETRNPQELLQELRRGAVLRQLQVLGLAQVKEPLRAGAPCRGQVLQAAVAGRAQGGVDQFHGPARALQRAVVLAHALERSESHPRSEKMKERKRQ